MTSLPTRRDLGAAAKLTLDRPDRSGVGAPPSLLIDLADLIGYAVVLLAAPDTKPLKDSFTQSLRDGTLVHRRAANGPGLDRALWSSYWAYLPSSHAARADDEQSPTTGSDVHSTREWHRTATDSDVSRPQGLDRELIVDPASNVASASARTLMQLFFLRRRGPEDSDRDLDLLTALWPHLRSAHPDAERRRQDLEPRLTARQQEILTLVADGHTNAQIARQLAISAGTVRKHLENIYRTLGVTNRIAAISRAHPDRPRH